MLDKLHWGAEDSVRCAMEMRVRPQVRRIRFDALLVPPEGVAVESVGALLVTGAIPSLAKGTVSIELASGA